MAPQTEEKEFSGLREDIPSEGPHDGDTTADVKSDSEKDLKRQQKLDFMRSKRKIKTIDTLINELGNHPSWMMYLCLAVCLGPSLLDNWCVYIIEFAGYVPNEEITCLTEKCRTHRDSFPIDNNGAIDPLSYHVPSLCGAGLEYGTDYEWAANITSDHSLSVEYGKLCDQLDVKMLNTIYHAGALVGSIFSTITLDLIGRKKTSLIAMATFVTSIFVTFFITNFKILMVMRFFQGFGNIVTFFGPFIWLVEYIPGRFRQHFTSLYRGCMVISYLVMVVAGYYIEQWRYQFLALSLTLIPAVIPFIFLPDSPRYYMAVGKEEEAKKSVEFYARIAGKEIDFTEIALVATENNKIEQTSEGSKSGFFRDFLEHKWLSIETAVMFLVWPVAFLILFGINYSWGEFGGSLYVSFAMAAGIEAVAYMIVPPICGFLGRKTGVVGCLFIISALFLIAIIPWQWTPTWSLARLCSLLALVPAAILVCVLPLYTGELAPTTHRGFIVSGAIAISRFGGFVGPLMTQAIPKAWARMVVFAVLAFVCALLVLLLPETRGSPLIAEAVDVTCRRKEMRKKTKDDKEKNEGKIEVDENRPADEDKCTDTQFKNVELN